MAVGREGKGQGSVIEADRGKNKHGKEKELQTGFREGGRFPASGQQNHKTRGPGTCKKGERKFERGNL